MNVVLFFKKKKKNLFNIKNRFDFFFTNLNFLTYKTDLIFLHIDQKPIFFTLFQNKSDIKNKIK